MGDGALYLDLFEQPGQKRVFQHLAKGKLGGVERVPLASILPPLNAALNALSATLVVSGYLCIRRGKVAPHKCCMLSALGVSPFFSRRT